jgi:hypothetical protein
MSLGFFASFGIIKKCCVSNFVYQQAGNIINADGTYTAKPAGYVLDKQILDCKTGALIQDLGPDDTTVCPPEDQLNPPKKCNMEDIFGKGGLYDAWVSYCKQFYGIPPYDSKFVAPLVNSMDLAHNKAFNDLWSQWQAFEQGHGKCPTKMAKDLRNGSFPGSSTPASQNMAITPPASTTPTKTGTIGPSAQTGYDTAIGEAYHQKRRLSGLGMFV